MVDPRGALEDEEGEEEEEDWEDMPEREGRFDMVMNMIPGRYYCSFHLNKFQCIAASGSASGGSRASRSSDRAGRRGRGR